MIDKHTIEHWDGKQWRNPDVFVDHSKVGLGVVAIWYGPEGVNGCYATVVESNDGNYFEIAEYVCVADFSDDPEREPDNFLVTKTGFIRDELKRFFRRQKIRIKNNKDFCRWVAGLGVAQSSYWGGVEEYESELPR